MSGELDTGLLIGGQWLDGKSEFPVINPYTGEEIARVASAGAEQLDLAVREARSSRMDTLSAAERFQILMNVSREIAVRKDELAVLIVRETAKPLRYALGEVERAAQTFSFAAGAARTIHGKTMNLDAHPGGKGYFGFYHRFPLGVIGAITPFNFPLNLSAHKIAPALAAANSVVHKPASATPLSALALGRIVLEAGAPPGALNVLPGSGSVLGEAVARHPGINMLTFTGSLEVGEKIRRSAGIKKVTLELGSNSALVIEDSDRLEQAVERALVGAFSFSGQVCISIQRILLNHKLADRFLDLFLPRVKALRSGDPLDPQTEIGPMISESEACRIELWIGQAVSQGARILTGGERSGAFYAPTVVDQISPEMDIYRREAFAPIVCIERYRDFGDALQRVNNSIYGLQAGVFTESLHKALAAFRTLEVGGVIINDFPTFRVDQMPYGGVKGSGSGREGPAFAVEEMTELRLCCLKL